MNVALRLTRRLSQSAVGRTVRKKFNSAFSSKYLLLTNVTLSTVSSGCGDLLAQYYELLTGEEAQFSLQRNMKVTFTGTLVGPMFHYWYLFLDRILPGRTARVIFSKVFLDMTIAPPVNIFFYIGSLGIMDGEKWPKIKSDMIEKGKDLWLAEWMVWPPASAVAFYILPTRFRVLFESSLSLIVDGYYSYVRFRDHDSELLTVQNTNYNSQSQDSMIDSTAQCDDDNCTDLNRTSSVLKNIPVDICGYIHNDRASELTIQEV